AALKRIDPTYTINTERQFQLRNAKGHEVELLLPATLADKWEQREKLRPVAMPEQDWLLRGSQISHVVCDASNIAARVAAPDPRWFGLHKMWLSRKPGRTSLKPGKDDRQGRAVLDLTAERMPRFPIDGSFRAQLPEELVPCFDRWAAGRPRRR